MSRENFVSDTLSRKRFQEILLKFEESSDYLGGRRNLIKIISYEGRKMVVKSFKVPNFVNKIAYRFFRKSKAERSYLNAHLLLKNGILTPEPVAYLEKYTSTGFYRSYYLSVYQEHDFTYREITSDENLKDKENILNQFTRFMYKMHEAGIYFLDNSPGNTLIKKNGDSYTFALVDLNRMKFYQIPFQDRLKNFQRLAPEKWVYEIMGTEYARLSGADPAKTIATMWQYTVDFQKVFHRRRAFKNKRKALFTRNKK